MKIIKTALCFALTILISTPFTVGLHAEAKALGYAYADLDSTVYFCSQKSEDYALFAIPQTYCVQILGEDGDWYYAKYAEDSGAYRAVYGYCLKSDVIKIDQPPEYIYLNYTVSVTYKSDRVPEFLPSLEIELNAAYYGEYTLGKTSLSYVYCGEKFGYISERVVDYPLNDLPKSTSATIDEPKTENGTMLITALVITLCATIVIAVLFFSGRKKPT